MTVTALRLLIVEDEALIRFSLADAFLDAGFDVLQAADAQQALAIIDANPDIDAVFSDVDMPGAMNGLALARHVVDSWPHISVALTSAYLKVARNALPASVPFFPKPYQIDAVVNHMCGLVRQRA
ncbi:response regulator [Neorhizobium sp. NPDC001467]|uniref:response regulator n=1 Tax=Neorhizobium sp. NPDC001467 TaxID=3390595 RepID=UPI003D052B2B